jgi:signal peptidase I
MEKSLVNSYCDYDNYLILKKILLVKKVCQCRVITDSMIPIINVGDVIKVVPVENRATLRRFDIVVYWDGEKLISHYIWHQNRILKHQEEIYTTRSLKEYSVNDVPIKISDILGFVENFQIPFWTKTKIILYNYLKNSG